MKLFESELKVMELLWENDSLTAKEIAQILNDKVGWSKTTTYTIIKKCIEKGAIERTNPHFVCKALIPKNQVQQSEVRNLVDRLFNGSKSLLVASLLGDKKLNPNEINELKEIVNNLEDR